MTLESPQIILASSSPYRQQLLQKTGLNFHCESPEINEQPHPNEKIEQMVARLSAEKAKIIATRHPDAIIIASDQSASLKNGQPLDKPGNYENAFAQLKAQRGQTINFYTGLVVYDPNSQQYLNDLDITKVSFRNLTDQQIHHYILTEQPYNCAGSFKSEGLGITLFSKIETLDPNALIGLPLIKLVSLLSQIGITLPLAPVNQPTNAPGRQDRQN